MKKIKMVALILVIFIVSNLIIGCQAEPQKQYSKGTKELAEKICHFAENHQTDDSSTLIFIGVNEGKKEKILTLTYSTISQHKSDLSEGGIREMGHTTEKYYTVTKKGISDDSYIGTQEGGYIGIVGSGQRAPWYMDDDSVEHISKLMDVAEYIISDGANNNTISNE